MSQRPQAYFRHGIEEEVPRIHELVLMNDYYKLIKWLNNHPDEIENNFRHKTPLLLAIKHDSFDCFKILLDRNANIEETNPHKETAVLIAVRLNRTQMIRNLISKNANIRTQDRMTRTVTEILISRDDVETLKFIHEQRENLLDHDLHNQEFPLTLAVSHQARKCINYILSLKPKVQSFLIYRKFSYPISAAIRRNDVQTLSALTQLDEFPYIINKRIHKSISYIHLAVEKQRAQIVDILLNNGAVVDLLDNDGNTPAHYARDIPTLKVLIRHFACLDITNKSNETPFQKAEKEKRNGIYHYIRLYKIEGRELPWETLHDRFGAYYKERSTNRSTEDDDAPISGEKLPPLFDDLPDLEEDAVSSPPALYKEEQAALAARKEIFVTAHCEKKIIPPAVVRSEMYRQDGITPTVKIRHIRRLLRTRSKRIPPPPGFDHTYYPTLSGPEDSDIEQDVIYGKDFKMPQRDESEEDSDLDSIA